MCLSFTTFFHQKKIFSSKVLVKIELKNIIAQQHTVEFQATWQLPPFIIGGIGRFSGRGI